MTRSYLGYVSSQTTDTIPVAGYGTATGGTSSSITIGGENYTLLTFTSSGTLTVTRAGFFDVLVVSGGGGARPYTGQATGGGGGGGGVLEASAYFSTNQTVTIGAGGTQTGFSGSLTASNGNESVVGTRPTGVAAGQNNVIDPSNGPGQGNVGGGCGSISANSNASIDNFFGRKGGNAGGNTTSAGGGGGGGAGAVGGNGSGTTGGNGGDGHDASAWRGESAGTTRYAGGGGGGGSVTNGTGGTGGGGTAAAGSTNTGGGGGNNGGTGYNGGSGIVLVRFKV